jgi:hypothetical protein
MANFKRIAMKKRAKPPRSKKKLNFKRIVMKKGAKIAKKKGAEIAMEKGLRSRSFQQKSSLRLPKGWCFWATTAKLELRTCYYCPFVGKTVQARAKHEKLAR